MRNKIKKITLYFIERKRLYNKIEKLKEQIIENDATIDFLIKENNKNKEKYIQEHKKYSNLQREYKEYKEKSASKRVGKSARSKSSII